MEGNITWSSTPNPNPPQLGNSTGPASAPSRLGRNAGKASAHFQAGSVSLPSWEVVQAGQMLTPRQAVPQQWVHAMQALFPRQAVLPQPRNRAANTGANSQAGSANSLPCMPGRSAGALSQADQNLSPSQGTSDTTAGDAASSSDNTTIMTGEQGAETQRAGALAPFQAGTSPI